MSFAGQCGAARLLRGSIAARRASRHDLSRERPSRVRELGREAEGLHAATA